MNNLETYSISTVEHLTGIKAHTLRIWEKRYKSLIPHRTDTNIRFYDEQQLKKILNISTLLNHGHKISTLSTYSDEKLSELLQLLFEEVNTEANDVEVNLLVNYMLSFDERSFDKVFSNIILKYGFYDAITKVIYPFLRKTGMLWSTSNAAPSQEHFASGLIKRKLFAAIDGIPYPVSAKKKFVLFLPPGEWHEIGLLVAEFLIRKQGGDSIYLGQSVPYDSLRVAIEKAKPTHLLTFFTAGSNIWQELKTISALCTEFSTTFLAYTGIDAGVSFDNIVFLDAPEAIFKYI